jgi:hypothetical protein
VFQKSFIIFIVVISFLLQFGLRPKRRHFLWDEGQVEACLEKLENTWAYPSLAGLLVKTLNSLRYDEIFQQPTRSSNWLHSKRVIPSINYLNNSSSWADKVSLRRKTNCSSFHLNKLDRIAPETWIVNLTERIWYVMALSLARAIYPFIFVPFSPSPHRCRLNWKLFSSQVKENIFLLNGTIWSGNLCNIYEAALRSLKSAESETRILHEMSSLSSFLREKVLNWVWLDCRCWGESLTLDWSKIWIIKSVSTRRDFNKIMNT